MTYTIPDEAIVAGGSMIKANAVFGVDFVEEAKGVAREVITFALTHGLEDAIEARVLARVDAALRRASIVEGPNIDHPGWVVDMHDGNDGVLYPTLSELLAAIESEAAQ